MSSYNEMQSEQISVHEIDHLSNQKQAEAIADRFSSISNEYEPIHDDDINLEDAPNCSSIPIEEPHQVYEYLRKLNVKSSTVKDDIPAKILKEFAVEIATPLSDVINCMVVRIS